MYLTEKHKIREIEVLMNLLSEFGYSSIKKFQSNAGLVVDGIFGNKSYQALYKHILNPVNLYFTDFNRTTSQKTMIVWHHSAGWDNARGMYDWWKVDGRDHVATPAGITDNGKLYLGFDEKYISYHLGCNHNPEVFKEFKIPFAWRELDFKSIGIEVCSAGWLDENKKSWFGYTPPEEMIVELNHRGYKYYEKITDAECKTLKYWTLLNALRFNIPLYYKEWDMWNLSRDALTGVPGIYTHNSFRPPADKNDISPQANVIKTAKELADYYS